MATFGKLASKNAAIMSLAGDSETTKPIKLLPVDEICPRFENKYLANEDKSKSLKESIKNVGLIEPINVVQISEYISYIESKSIKERDEEVKYLEQMEREGVKYFVSTGHRRFKAYVSILLGKDVITDSDWENNYEEIKIKCEDIKKKSLQTLLTGESLDVEDKWITIPSIIINGFEKEKALYNDSNTTQRELTGFEIIVNSIDEIKRSGEWDNIVEKVIEERVSEMTDRKVREKINNLIKANLIENPTDSTISNLRKTLLSVPSKYIQGTDSKLNELIVNYIKENKQRNVSVSNVNYTRKILDRLDKEMIQYIFDGLLSFKDAKVILSKYDEVDIDSIKKEIRNKNFKVEKIESSQKTIKYTSRQLIDLIYDIRNGKKTVEEVIKLIEKNEN